MRYVIRIAVVAFVMVTGFCWAGDDSAGRMVVGPVRVGDARIHLDLDDFEISVDSPSFTTTAEFIQDSLQWIRTDTNLLVPRVRLALNLFLADGSIHIGYAGASFIPEKRAGHYYTEVYVALFDSRKITIFADGKPMATVAVSPRTPHEQRETHLIDYSCVPYGVTLECDGEDYISVGCSMQRLGRLGSERPRLEVLWTSPTLRLPHGSPPPYAFVLTDSDPVSTTVMGHTGKLKTMTIKAGLPARLHRFKTAVGVGPYVLESRHADERNDGQAAPCFMLYANLFLTENTSVRVFDALVFRSSMFNNSGLYVAYELAHAFDRRLAFVPLLGLQGITFAYGSTTDTFTQVIFPQGLEVVYRHAFGFENYLLAGGVFISPEADITYTNTWIRFGKRFFLEFNYIEWGYTTKYTSMYGVSLGTPLLSLF